jgi:hypothetical protein
MGGSGSKIERDIGEIPEDEHYLGLYNVSEFIDHTEVFSFS